MIDKPPDKLYMIKADVDIETTMFMLTSERIDNKDIEYILKSIFDKEADALVKMSDEAYGKGYDEAYGKGYNFGKEAAVEALKELRETRDWLQRQLKGKDLGKLYGNQAGYYLMEVSSALENLAKKMGWNEEKT